MELCLLVLEEEIERLFGGLKSGLSTRDVMRVLCGAEDTEYSWRNFTLVEQGGNVIAGLCAFPAQDHSQMMRRLPAHLQEGCGIGVPGLMRLFARSLWSNLSNRGLPEPSGGLYIHLGAVFPAHQRTGVARSTLEYLFDHARAAGVHEVSLHVDRSNHGAIRLYNSLGFRETAGRSSARKMLMTLPLG